MRTKLNQSYAILNALRLENGMYLASSSEDYSHVWLRDSFYESLPYLGKDEVLYTKTYHRILDLFKEYEWKIRIHTTKRARETFEFIHARYSAHDVKEIDVEWGHAQHDAVGAVLFGIAEGVAAGYPIVRYDKDLELIQLVVDYLNCCEYWHDEDNGMWEENREVHMSSVGAVVAGLTAIQEAGLAIVPQEMIDKGWQTLDDFFPFESATKPVDLAQLSLIYPYGIYQGEKAQRIIQRVENMLLRERGVLRYNLDSYYSLHNTRELPKPCYNGAEAEWTFGLPWLSLCHLLIGNIKESNDYLERAESVMLPDGSLPELYFANSEEHNGNTPLGWSNAMYIVAFEKLEHYVSLLKDISVEESPAMDIENEFDHIA